MNTLAVKITYPHVDWAVVVVNDVFLGFLRDLLVRFLVRELILQGMAGGSAGGIASAVGIFAL